MTVNKPVRLFGLHSRRIGGVLLFNSIKQLLLKSPVSPHMSTRLPLLIGTVCRQHLCVLMDASALGESFQAIESSCTAFSCVLSFIKGEKAQYLL
jgi:hypothetical protein